ncbi:hypothetical protein JTE90_027159 [Oedothorax gibbosus]|uniref:KANL3/Tex30 alpha/beta hydrolase-like domain-containing protein n=1 Tax=Oedothorax gibbosus TaxID=931172 RepID=A0AAV6U000_9ARAC|nr:hypothetical protein JTE90_027159 [Oedothorax gibbosus]
MCPAKMKCESVTQSIVDRCIVTKNHYPNRPLILLGWTLGALLACHIALQEPVDGVICLGFPLTGVNGSRGDLNDPLLDNKVPTLFVVGQNAYMCSTDDMEDFRSRMRAETGLVVVGGADDLLRMCPAKMKCESVTQSIVDRCIVDEISEFLTSVVVKLPSTSTMATPTIASKPCTPIIEEEDNDRDATWLPDQEGKRRRRKPREYSPELSPVRKRQKHHLSRQSTSSKYRLSPTSSENSSCGSEKATVTKPAKKPFDKRMGRPTSSPWRKRTPGRPVANPALVTSPKKTIPSYTPEELEYRPTKTPTSAPKSILPFSKNILPKKNEIVDVNAAFGSDSSFLPRPLTPPEPEDTVSAEETERVLAELEGKETEGNAAEEPQSSSSITSITSWLNDALLDKPFAPITSDVEKEATMLPIETTLPTVVPVQLPTVTTEERRPISLASLLSQGKTINSNAIQTLKTSGGISLLTNTQVSPTKSTFITVPSSSISTSSSLLTGIRTQGGKMIQLVSKPKDKEQTSQPQTFQTNLSLLSDVAGTRKAEATATLVKLDRPSPFQSVKCVKVIKSISSPPSRIETAEEMVEKQLAIQALNKSIGIESSSSLGKESGYSICYAKADGSIVSRSVTRPSYPGLISQGRGRGVRHQFPSTAFRFSHK